MGQFLRELLPHFQIGTWWDTVRYTSCVKVALYEDYQHDLDPCRRWRITKVSIQSSKKSSWKFTCKFFELFLILIGKQKRWLIDLSQLQPYLVEVIININVSTKIFRFGMLKNQIFEKLQHFTESNWWAITSKILVLYFFCSFT